MSRDAEYEAKMDALDLVINVLKDHEKNLDRLIGRLADALDKKEEKRAKEEARPLRAVECEDWQDFKEKGKGSELVAFHLKAGSLIVEALSKNYVLRYSEDLPRIRFHVKREVEGYSIEGHARNAKTANLKDILSLFRGELRCGLRMGIRGSRVDVNENEFTVNVTYEVNKEKIKEWLSWELNVPKKNIILGKALV